jgi:hypothetical protein
LELASSQLCALTISVARANSPVPTKTARTFLNRVFMVHHLSLKNKMLCCSPVERCLFWPFRCRARDVSSRLFEVLAKKEQFAKNADVSTTFLVRTSAKLGGIHPEKRVSAKKDLPCRI